MESSTSTADAAVLDNPPRDPGGKYLTFRLGREQYGVQILKVRELIGMTDITRVPQVQPYVRGVINLRGKVIPVIDLRAKLRLPRADDNEQTCIVVVDVGVMMGLIVDTVEEVCDIPSSDVEAPPEVVIGADTGFILGMGKVGNAVKTLLDIDHILMTQDLVAP